MTPSEIRAIIEIELGGSPSGTVTLICNELLSRLPQPYVGRYGRVCPSCQFKMRGLRTRECPNCGHVMREKMTYGGAEQMEHVMSENDCRSCGTECCEGHKRGAGVCLPCGCLFHSQCLNVFIQNGSRSCPEHRHVKIPEHFMSK